ncbi:MAG: hypothetical protein B7X88_24320 [Polaromonas sp. 17-63-33]|nr:MAG: hypothetical protein B7X88_24320 [Polaromonas sp. 17-63-33]
MQETVERWRRSGQKIEDAWLARMGSAHFAHVNFRGMFRFGVSHGIQKCCRARLLPGQEVWLNRSVQVGAERATRVLVTLCF